MPTYLTQFAQAVKAAASYSATQASALKAAATPYAAQAGAFFQNLSMPTAVAQASPLFMIGAVVVAGAVVFAGCKLYKKFYKTPADESSAQSAATPATPATPPATPAPKQGMFATMKATVTGALSRAKNAITGFLSNSKFVGLFFNNAAAREKSETWGVNFFKKHPDVMKDEGVTQAKAHEAAAKTAVGDADAEFNRLSAAYATPYNAYFEAHVKGFVSVIAGADADADAAAAAVADLQKDANPASTEEAIAKQARNIDTVAKYLSPIVGSDTQAAHDQLANAVADAAQAIAVQKPKPADAAVTLTTAHAVTELAVAQASAVRFSKVAASKAHTDMDDKKIKSAFTMKS